MNCVILQPSYIPWRGYFHQIALSDVFVFYDDVKYDKNGWRNRNRIKTKNGSIWLSIPVFTKGVETNQTPINQIKINWQQNWNRKHWQTLQTHYAKAPYFEKFVPLLESFYQQHPDLLSDFTIELTIRLARELGIQHTKFIRSSEIEGITGQKTDRLVQILSKLNVTHYISGPSAQSYIEAEKFQEAGITLEYMKYEYSEYPQLYPPYDPQVSILDLMFMTGPNALDYILQKPVP